MKGIIANDALPSLETRRQWAFVIDYSFRTHFFAYCGFPGTKSDRVSKVGLKRVHIEEGGAPAKIGDMELLFDGARVHKIT